MLFAKFLARAVFHELAVTERGRYCRYGVRIIGGGAEGFKTFCIRFYVFETGESSVLSVSSYQRQRN